MLEKEYMAGFRCAVMSMGVRGDSPTLAAGGFVPHRDQNARFRLLVVEYVRQCHGAFSVNEQVRSKTIGRLREK